MWRLMVRTLLLLSVCRLASSMLVEWDRVVFVIRSESHESVSAHNTRAELEASLFPNKALAILMSHEDLQDSHGTWTFFPLIRELSQRFGDQALWFVILATSSTRVNVSNLERLLATHNSDEEIFLGYGLKDEDMSIIHHYDPPSLYYPHPMASMVFSFHLVNQLRFRLEEEGEAMNFFPKDFNIDPHYELAKVIRHMYEFEEDGEPNQQGDGVQLIHDHRLCYLQHPNEQCALWPSDSPVCKTSSTLDLNAKTLFAVKTCSKYHEERLGVVLDTWHSAAINVVLVSEEQSRKWGTTNLKGTVMDTEEGHCAKTMAILNHFFHKTDLEWLVVVDDDTVMGVQRMLEVIQCTNSSSAMAMGQRYGYGVAMGQHGYDYPTGGAGMIFNREMVSKLISAKFCKCPKPSTPDDMHIGACITSLGLTLHHIRGMHQARPEDYHSKIVESQSHVTFHKHWNTDPREVYRRFFAQSDAQLKKLVAQRRPKHLMKEEQDNKRDEL